MKNILLKAYHLTGLTVVSFSAVALGLFTIHHQPVIADDNFTKFQQAILKRHNYYREQHGVSALNLDTKLNEDAQRWADTLASEGKFEHDKDAVGQGENIYVYSTSSNEPSPVENDANGAVDSWYSEIKDYDFGKPGFSLKTGHFTQVVWNSTTKLGCGIAYGKYKNSNGRYVVCRYVEPGNVDEEYGANVPPKK